MHTTIFKGKTVSLPWMDDYILHVFDVVVSQDDKNGGPD